MRKETQDMDFAAVREQTFCGFCGKVSKTGESGKYFAVFEVFIDSILISLYTNKSAVKCFVFVYCAAVARRVE